MSRKIDAVISSIEQFINGITSTIKIDRSTTFSPVTEGLVFDLDKQTVTVYPFSTDLSDYIEVVTRKDGTTVIIDEKPQSFSFSEISKIDTYVDGIKEMSISNFKLK